MSDSTKIDIAKALSDVFGDTVPVVSQVAFVNHLTAIIADEGVPVDRESLPVLIKQAGIIAAERYQKMAKQVLLSDSSFNELVSLTYDRLRA